MAMHKIWSENFSQTFVTNFRILCKDEAWGWISLIRPYVLGATVPHLWLISYFYWFISHLGNFSKHTLLSK